MPGFNANDYVSVAERLSAAQSLINHIHADAPVMLTDVMGYIRVTVTLQDGHSATGMASFRLDLTGGRAQATNPLEDCETSAVGRALAFLGFAASRSIASREEMQEAERRTAQRTPESPRQQRVPAPRLPAVGKPVMTLDAARAAIAALPGATAEDIAAAEDLDDRDLLRDLYRQIKSRPVTNGKMEEADLPL